MSALRAVAAVLVVVLVACGGGDGVEGLGDRLGVSDESPLARFLPDPPLFGVQMAVGIDDAGGAVHPAVTFAATDPQVTALVALGQIDGEATLEVEWRAIGAGIGESERLFAHEIVVGSYERAYSVGVSPGRLAPGLYEVNASLGAHEVSTLWRVADAEQAAGAASASASAEAGPPAAGESGVIEPQASEASTPGQPYDPCALSLYSDPLVMFIEYSVAAGSSGCPESGEVVVSAAVVGWPADIGRGLPSFGDITHPCLAGGGSDMPGTVVHFSARYADDIAEVAGDQLELEDPEEPPLIVFQSDPPSGSRVEAGDTVRLGTFAFKVPFAKGLRWGELRSLDGVLAREEREATPCTLERFGIVMETTYTVPEDPPPVIELSAVVEDWDGLSTTETITLVTEDVEHWSGTFASVITGSGCSGSAEGAVRLTVEGGQVTGSIDATEAGSCDTAVGPVAFGPRAGTLGLRGTFDGAAFQVSVIASVSPIPGDTTIASWVCFYPAPAITVGPPGTASAQWTFGGENTYSCSMTLQREDGAG